jgi:competence protein ComEA
MRTNPQRYGNNSRALRVDTPSTCSRSTLMIRQFITRAALVCAAVFATAAVTSAQAATDANKASQAELESVKGIGPGLAGKILKARETGAFKDWSDMVDRVSGVGPANAARFSEAGLTVAGSAYAPQASGAQVKAGAKTKSVNLEGSAAPTGKAERVRKGSAAPAV